MSDFNTTDERIFKPFWVLMHVSGKVFLDGRKFTDEFVAIENARLLAKETGGPVYVMELMGVAHPIIPPVEFSRCSVVDGK